MAKIFFRVFSKSLYNTVKEETALVKLETFEKYKWLYIKI